MANTQAQVTSTIRASSNAPLSTRSTPSVPCGWRRRSVGEPGLKIRKPPSPAESSGMCECPNTTRSASGNFRRMRTSRPAAGPLSWIIATRRPATEKTAVCAAPQAATSGPSLLPATAITGAYWASSSRTDAVHTSPACRIRSAPRRTVATAGGQDFQRRGACVSDRTITRTPRTRQPADQAARSSLHASRAPFGLLDRGKHRGQRAAGVGRRSSLSGYLFGVRGGGCQPEAGGAASATLLDRFQRAVEQEKQPGNKGDGNNEDHVHARQVPVGCGQDNPIVRCRGEDFFNASCS